MLMTREEAWWANDFGLLMGSKAKNHHQQRSSLEVFRNLVKMGNIHMGLT
jgi:hypothetical protein